MSFDKCVLINVSNKCIFNRCVRFSQKMCFIPFVHVKLFLFRDLFNMSPRPPWGFEKLWCRGMFIHNFSKMPFWMVTLSYTVEFVKFQNFQ